LGGGGGGGSDPLFLSEPASTEPCQLGTLSEDPVPASSPDDRE
jgi:hypothetical protein